MLDQYPYPEYEGRRNIVTGIILAVITCGLYSLYWQYKQMETLNAWLGREDYSVILTTTKVVCFFETHNSPLCDSCFRLSCLYSELCEVLFGLHKRLFSLSIRQRGFLGLLQRLHLYLLDIGIRCSDMFSLKVLGLFSYVRNWNKFYWMHRIAVLL